MRIGIITDIHDEVKNLAAGLASLQGEAVDAIVCLGDATDLFGSWDCADEVAGLLRQAAVIGVWATTIMGCVAMCATIIEIDSPPRRWSTWQPCNPGW